MSTRTLFCGLAVAVALIVGLTAFPACALPVPDPFRRADLQAGLDRLVESGSATAALLRIQQGHDEWAAACVRA
jgi:hypothetical protein